MMFKFVAVGLAYTAAFAAAYTAPKMTGTEPAGNAITSPGSKDIIPAGKPFTIIWEPTTDGPVTLVFLKGPSSNAVPQYAIAEHIENSGSYDWTPSTSIAPGTTGFGILLVDDVTGEYQYSTQFGIKNSNYGSSSDDDTTTSKASAGATTSKAVTKTTLASYDATSTKAAPATYTTASSDDDDESNDDDESDDDDEDATTSSAATTSSSLTKPTVAPTTAVVTIKPSASANSTVPTLRTTTSAATSTQSTGPAVATGAAVHTVASSFAGLVFAAGVAVLAL